MIEVKGLRKVFGDITAVDGVEFSAAKGDVLGFLGPNGAGKSTTMKMLCCFLPPDGGTATICGNDILQEPLKVKSSIGYLAENAPTYEEMTVREFLKFIAAAREVSNPKEAIEKVSKSCSISNVMNQTIGTLSKGYRRRVGLAQALIHDPQVLLLDEPTDGLDPNQKHDVRELIKSLAKEKCIIISTHILEEVEAICNRVVIIAQGKVLTDSTPQELKDKEGATLDEVFRKLTSATPETASAVS